jgi:membrane dipeptidase
MRQFLRPFCAAAAAAVLATAGLMAQDAAIARKAGEIHERVMTLDTHVDINASNFTAECNYKMDLGNQVNLPKMLKGGLDAAFFIVYVGQNQTDDAFTPAGYGRAYQAAIEKFDAVHRLAEKIAPDQIGLALTSADARRIYKSGRKVAFIGVENGYPIGEDIKRVKEFHDRGARYMSLAHNGHSQLSDSNTGEATGWKWNGLSPLGKEVIAEMNRVGIMIDVSHPSKASMMQTLAITKAPIIASHSSVRKLANHSRNLDDEQLLALKKNGGVMQTVAFNGYVKIAPGDSPARAAALAALRTEFGLPAGTPLAAGGGRGGRGGGGRGNNPCAPAAPTTAPATASAPAGEAAAGRGGQGRGGGRGNALAGLSEEQRTALQTKLADINTRFPPPAPVRATVKDFVDHIDYAVKLIGIDHVGISSDFDGGGGVDGWNGADETFNVTHELVSRGYSEKQIEKLWSGNLLRVLDQVQAVAKKLQAK